MRDIICCGTRAAGHRLVEYVLVSPACNGVLSFLRQHPNIVVTIGPEAPRSSLRDMKNGREVSVDRKAFDGWSCGPPARASCILHPALDEASASRRSNIWASHISCTPVDSGRRLRQLGPCPSRACLARPRSSSKILSGLMLLNGGQCHCNSPRS